jgi:hypothetical protein
MNPEEIKNELDLNIQFNRYLNLVGLTHVPKDSTQFIETRRAFYGACGQMIALLNDVIGIMDEDDAVIALKNLTQQIGQFWINQNNQQS